MQLHLLIYPHKICAAPGFLILGLATEQTWDDECLTSSKKLRSVQDLGQEGPAEGPWVTNVYLTFSA